MASWGSIKGPHEHLRIHFTFHSWHSNTEKNSCTLIDFTQQILYVCGRNNIMHYHGHESLTTFSNASLKAFFFLKIGPSGFKKKLDAMPNYGLTFLINNSIRIYLGDSCFPWRDIVPWDRSAHPSEALLHHKIVDYIWP